MKSTFKKEKILKEKQKKISKVIKRIEKIEFFCSDSITRQNLHNLKYYYTLCEIAYKDLLKKIYSKNKQMTINVNQVYSVFKCFCFDFKEDFLKNIFGSYNTDSARRLRNKITHSMDIKNKDELNLKSTKYIKEMKEFLANFKEGPNNGISN
jgi:hypothetical protein